MAATSYKFHWRNARPKPYDPYAEIPATKAPYPKQQQFHDLDVRHKGFIAGVGSGKSASGAAEMVKHLLHYPGSHVLITAPTYPMLVKSTRLKFFDILHPLSISRRNDQEKIVELTNGGIAWFGSLDNPDSIRGPTVSKVWLDEGAYAVEQGWNNLISRLRQEEFPRSAVLTSTPKGRNWVWQRWDGPKKVASYNFIHATSRDNPHNPEDFVPAMLETMATREAQQEVEGLFVSHSGLVYPTFSRTVHVKSRLWENNKARFKSIWYGHDWGHTHPMVILVCAVDGDGRLYILREWYEKRKTIEDVLYALCGSTVPEPRKADNPTPESLYGLFGKGEHVCDPAEAEHITTLNRRGFNAYGGNNEIQPGINEVDARLRVRDDNLPRLFVDESCVETIAEFEQYQYPEEQEGKVVKDLPVDAWNHSCLVGDTLVTTIRGEVPIEDIELGDIVESRHGQYHPVTAWALMRENAPIWNVATRDSVLRGTADHPVYVHGRGFVEIQKLHVGDATTAGSIKEIWNRTTDREDVYDITVDSVHEFMANGFLVKNCDVVRYLSMKLRTPAAFSVSQVLQSPAPVRKSKWQVVD